ncbi:dTDP-4-dehydrorhamnose 3,5-epimerase [Parasphingopyxis algicola]|uniref:dTDP-4-dehydrorhamnose 3,5-epimerase n=1 Tax=Parasphingopyxis algicola TaxID=2026624 RepID=UPI0015A35DC5|nr:dTDP-4-dehydrorhamnose 3,5-epimerase [Parasphingopyxis algicola]QLC24022.1 dTDP-4-dehydrorhamnose 3,5-epimerase [Parasphingopyxis algicola]
MRFTATDIADVKLVKPEAFADKRGDFSEIWREERFADAGIAGPWVQDNHSRSRRYVLRGIHYQIEQPQGKLVRASRGRIFDVAVDLRRASPTFAHWTGRELSAQNRRMLWIPPGFGHGFLTLSGVAHVDYKCTAYHAPAHQRTIIWNDPDVAVEWPLPDGEEPILSDADEKGVRLEQADLYA